MENGCFNTCPDMPSQQVQAEDLKAFERRVVEYVSSLGPQANRWRILLALTSVCIAIGSFGWAMDEKTVKISFLESLMIHKFFTISCISLIILIIFGAHKRIRAPQLILARVQLTLQDFNMSCDERGRLILKKTQGK
ncbi:nuclear envelope phosphatase-regulatory subunit 1-like [Rhopilema esculentum]|uniref:nuclear envelope phosphatase-regulatory subunit 1-like n=1 Tax=Rhopilema esculentum TaxID=499914 RepID=UPI0031D58D74